MANIVYTYHSSIKAQGRRTDLLNEVRNLLDIMDNDDITFCPMVKKLDSVKECSNKFKISARTVSRYLRVYLLIDELKPSLDDNLISLRASVGFAFTSADGMSLQYIGQVDSIGAPTAYRVLEENISRIKSLSIKYLNGTITSDYKILLHNANINVRAVVTQQGTTYDIKITEVER